MDKFIEKLDDLCPLYKNGTSNRELRHEFFKNIKTEIQAYLLGFIAADGSIDEERHTLSIHLSQSDKEICDLFIMERRKILCLNVRHGNKKHNKRKEQKPAAQCQRQFQTS